MELFALHVALWILASAWKHLSFKREAKIVLKLQKYKQNCGQESVKFNL